MGIRCADHVTPLYPQKLALTSPTGGGRSVGIVRSRTKATEFKSEVIQIAWGPYEWLLILVDEQNFVCDSCLLVSECVSMTGSQIFIDSFHCAMSLQNVKEPFAQRKRAQAIQIPSRTTNIKTLFFTCRPSCYLLSKNGT